MKKIYVYDKTTRRMVEKISTNLIPFFDGPPHDAMSLVWENFLLECALKLRKLHPELYKPVDKPD